VLVLVNGQPLTINWANRFIPAILQAGFTGPSGGKAVAEALFGDYNPGGKLTMTWPKTVGQIELNFPFKPGSHAGQSATADPNGYGKTHVNGALYPFAHGLSYTTFGYANLQVRPSAPGGEADIEVFVDVTNTGKRAGDEVVQLYLKDLVSSVTTYEMQLRGFERLRLQPGETKQVRFVLHPEDLALLDKDMNWRVEPGAFEVLVGSSSADIRQKQRFEVR
jgi:beta-glucosidase